MPRLMRIVSGAAPASRRVARVCVCLLSGVLMAGGTSAFAQPDLRSGRQAGTLMVYADDRRPNLYYYAPNELTLAELAPGKPDLRFLQMRYTGTRATGDQGDAVYRSLLTFRVLLPAIGPNELNAAKRAIAPRADVIQLRPLPLRRVEAVLVYVPLTEAAEPPKPQSLPAGHFQETDDAKQGPADVYWTERIYTLALDNETSQLVWSALQKGQVVLSVGYAFVADGIAGEPPVLRLSGPAELTDALRARLAGGSPDPQQSAPVVVRAGAFAVSVDAQRWPDLFVRADINERVPPGYAVLDVYCYDFQRPEAAIYEKRVDIEAEGVEGRPVTVHTRFRRKQPELYARTLRFPFAVRVDRPYRYRVVTTYDDGLTHETAWMERAEWMQLLDVTAPPQTEKPVETKEGK